MTKRIAAGGTNLNVVDQGAGPVLLLVHGFPLDHTMWSGQIKELSASYRVIAPDLRGFGGSDVTSDVVTMQQLTDDLASLLVALTVETPVTLCGLSMGGYVAWEFWQRHGERLHSLILCDTRAAADTTEVARARQMMAADVLERGPRVAAESMVPKLFAAATHQQQPEIVEATRQVILRTSAAAIAATQRGMAVRQDMTARLGAVQLPTLLLVGDEDAISTPAEMRSMADAMPTAEFVEIADAGHMAPLEQPAVVNKAIIGFLNDHA